MQGFCAVPEPVLAAAEARVCKWPARHVIRWLIESKLDEFGDDEYREVVSSSLDPWEAHSGVRFEFVSADPNLVFTTRPIDGQFGILAEAQLPCGFPTSTSTLFCWMDTREDWVNAQNPAGRMIDATRVLIHEIGHLLGLPHAPVGIGAIMEPSISQIRTLKPWDIQQAVLRYGDPSTTPGPGVAGPCEELLSKCFQGESLHTALKAWELLKRALANNGKTG